MALLTQAIEATITQRFRLPYFLYLPRIIQARPRRSGLWSFFYMVPASGERT